MSKSKLVLALVSGLALPLGALAAETTSDKPADSQMRQPTKPTPAGAEGSAASPMFQQLDADKDGFVSAKESEKSATVKGNFKTMDKNQDGKISAEEWREGGGQ